jgi:hypothetical protein
MASLSRDIPDMPAFLAAIRQRPAMWLGYKSIRVLHAMLAGFAYAEDCHDIAEPERFGGFDFRAFEEWVERKYNPRRLAFLSYSLAEQAAGSEESGFDLWFQWYDEFNASR